MGAITPLIPFSPLVTSTLGVITKRDTQTDTSALQAAQIKADNQADQIARNQKLKEDLATQRARFAAQGRSGSSGSAKALISGLLERSVQADRLDDTSTAAKLAKLNLQEEARQQSFGLNLLEKGASAAGDVITGLLR